MESTFLLDIIVGEGSSILQLLSSKDQSLLVWGNAFLVLDLGLDILNGVRRLDLQGDGLASESLNKDQSLLIRGNSFLILDLGLDILNGVRRFNLKGDGLASESLDKDLHTSSQSENQMQGTLLLDVVVGEGSSIFQLLSSEDQSLLIWRNSFLVLDLGLDILNGVRWLNLQGDGFAS